jgi:hypothetical protein
VFFPGVKRAKVKKQSPFSPPICRLIAAKLNELINRSCGMYANRDKGAWIRQRYGAVVTRKIEWDLTFREWLTWWKKNLGKDWRTKRGCKLGQFVMARKGDTGPYALGNIECITAEENTRRAGSYKRVKRLKAFLPPKAKGYNRGSQNGASKLTEAEVIAIFLSDERAVTLANKHKVRCGIISLIRNGIKWKHVTERFKDSINERG